MLLLEDKLALARLLEADLPALGNRSVAGVLLLPAQQFELLGLQLTPIFSCKERTVGTHSNWPILELNSSMKLAPHSAFAGVGWASHTVTAATMIPFACFMFGTSLQPANIAHMG